MNDHSPFGIPGLSRRRFLRRFGLGFGSLALTELLCRDGFTPEGQAANLLAPRVASFAPRAKHVIFLFMAGVPSQLDLYDYKPDLARKFRQPLPDEVRDGQRVTAMTLGANHLIQPSMFKFSKQGQSGL